MRRPAAAQGGQVVRAQAGQGGHGDQGGGLVAALGRGRAVGGAVGADSIDVAANPSGTTGRSYIVTVDDCEHVRDYALAISAWLTGN